MYLCGIFQSQCLNQSDHVQREARMTWQAVLTAILLLQLFPAATTV